MTEEQIREIIREELQDIIRLDRYTFNKPLQILDGRNIMVGTANGTSLGTETTQKVGVYGKKVSQHAAIAQATGGVTVDGQARASLNVLLDAIKDFGIIA
jgi:hypothetical protein